MLFDYWKALPFREKVHPADLKIVERHRGVFDLTIPPGHVSGRLRTAPIVACFLNPGIEQEDKEYLETTEGQSVLFDQICGDRDFPLQIPRWEKWFMSRVGGIRLTKEQLIRTVAIFNVCPYASKNANRLTQSILRDLPSAQLARQYLHEVLIPQAQVGERFLVICRGAWAWEVSRQRRLLECDTIRFAYPRGGHFGKEISNRISTWLESRPLVEREAS
jgi:hypothetical protein